MDDNVGKYVVHNGTLKESYEVHSFNSSQISGRAAYEVIRIIDGVPLFFEYHYERLKATFSSIGEPLQMTADQLCGYIKMLIEKTGKTNCNVKTVIYYEEGNQQLVYISKSNYPTEAEADAGVKAGLIRIERQNPNAKILNKKYRDTVNAKIAEGGYFEVILVDSLGRVTEGSKSNLFFVKENRIYTAPGDFVLKGITRKYVFEACKNAGFDVTEKFVGADEIELMEAGFLSGTSIKVLPIKAIDEIVLNSSTNPIISAVRREYDKILEKYIAKHVNMW